MALAVGETPDGINLDLADDLVEATGTVVPVTITTSANLPGGVYTATLVGRSDGVEVSVPLHFTIQEPDFTLGRQPADALPQRKWQRQPQPERRRPLRQRAPGTSDREQRARGHDPHPDADHHRPQRHGRRGVLTLRDTDLLPNGVYTLTVTGEDGLHTHSVDVTVTVAKPGFGLTTVRQAQAGRLRRPRRLCHRCERPSNGAPRCIWTLDQFSIVPGSVLGFATTTAGSPTPSLDVTGPATIYLIATSAPQPRQILYPLTVLGSSGDKSRSACAWSCK